MNERYILNLNKQKQYNFYKSIVKFLFILILSFSCSQSDSDSTKKINSSFNVHYSDKQGDPTLFSEEKISIHAKKIKHINDNSSQDKHEDDQIDDDIIKSDDDDPDTDNFSEHSEHKYETDEKHHKNHKHHEHKKKKEKQWTKIAFETEPMISMSLIRSLTTCPIPKLNLTKPTITTNVEWQIFVYCVLDILPKAENHRYWKKAHKKHGKKGKNKHKDNDDDNEDNENDIDDSDIEGIEYPEITKMQKQQDAYKFLKKSLRKFLKKYLFHNPDLTPEQKFALFERIFLVTKFRVLTQDEKAMVEDLIQRKGLNYTSIIYRQNWYFSQFYKDHFDFSQDPQDGYKSWEVYGKIVDEETLDLVDDMKYSIPSAAIYGFKTSGISQTESSLLDKIKNIFSSQPDLTYNFNLQFYLPEGMLSQSQNALELPILIWHNSTYELNITMVSLSSVFITDVTISLKKKPPLPDPNTPPEDPEPMWPNADTKPNPNIENLSWSVNPGGTLANCTAPSVITDNNASVIDGYSWQDFITCYLNVSIPKISQGKDYFPLVSKLSAFDLMFLVKDEYRNSDASVLKSDAEMIAAIFEVISLQQATSNDIQLIQASIDEKGIDQTLNSLLEKWYQSPVYSYFDYSQYNMPGITWYTVSGIVENSSGTPLQGAIIKLFDQRENEIAGSISNAQGEYSFQLKISDTMIGFQYKLKIILDGYGDREFSMVISSNKAIIQNISLNPIGKVSQDLGGQIASANKETVIDIPPGAVSTDVDFTISDMTIQPQPEIASSDGAIIEIKPSYTFEKPVMLTINIETLQSKYPEEKSWAIYSKQEGGEWEPVTNAMYDPSTKKIYLEVTHFSIFAIVPYSAINYTYHHPIGEVIDTKTITYPTGVPEAKVYGKNKLRDGGWNASIIDNLIIPKSEMKAELAKSGIELIDGTGCNEAGTSCTPILAKMSIDEAITINGSTMYVSGTANIIATVDMDLQTEQCKINPTASYPQIRLNSISGTRMDLSADLFIRNHKIPRTCLRERYKAVEIPTTFHCHDWSCHTHWQTIYILAGWDIFDCSYTINHNSHIQIVGFNGKYRRSGTGSDYQWVSNGFFDSGWPFSHVNLFKDRQTTIWEDIYAFLAERRIRLNIVAGLNTKITDLLNWAKNNNASGPVSTNEAYLKDPAFSDSNCHLFAPPSVTLLNIQNYYITGWLDGNTSSDVIWRSDLDGTYFIKTNGDCASNTPILESGSVSANATVTSNIKAEFLTAGVNTVRICVSRQYHETGGISFTIVRDDTIPNISINTDQPDYHDFISDSGGFDNTNITWSSDYNGSYQVKINTDCNTAGGIIQTGGIGFVYADRSVTSRVYASELAEGLNPVNICVRARNGFTSVATKMIFRDDVAPTTVNSPLEGKYDQSQSVSLTCDDLNCLNIVYTTDSTDPSFVNDGTISNGILYSAPWTTPDPKISTFKFRSIDKAGNVEAVKTAVYTVDSNIPETLVFSNERSSLSVGDELNSSMLIWNTTRAGLTYMIRIGGTDCTSGIEIERGTTLSGENIVYIPASRLDVGENTVRICVANLIGNFSSTTQTIDRYETEPRVSILQKSRNVLSNNNGYSISDIDWESTQGGTYEIKINSPCSDTASTPIKNGDVSRNTSMTTSINDFEIKEKINLIYICVTNYNGLTNAAITQISLDTVKPTTFSNIINGTFGAQQEVVLTCNDNTDCDSLVYTLDGTDPDFTGNGTIINQSKSNSLSTKIIVGTGGDGDYTIKYCSKDIIGNIERINTANITINSSLPSVTILPTYKQYLSINGYISTDIEWYSNRDVSYFIKKGPSCTNGIDIIGPLNAIQDERVFSTINASNLDGGVNSIRICVTDNFSQSAEGIAILTRDDTPPTTTNIAGEGAYGIVQEVNLKCNENCSKTIYSIDGSIPDFDINGNIINGYEYIDPWVTPDTFNPSETITEIKFRSIDKAGNIEEVKSSSYIIDTTLPTISIVSTQSYVITDVEGFNSSDILWNVNREGLSYSVLIGGSDCETGKVSMGSGGTGKTTMDTNISSRILADDLVEGENIIRICVQNYALKYGYTTLRIARDNSVPQVNLIQPIQHDFLSINGYTNSVLQWESTYKGAYLVKINGDCKDGLLSSGYHNTGTAFKNIPVTSTIEANDLQQGDNAIHVCVTGSNQLVGEGIFAFVLDNSPPNTTTWPSAGNYGSAQSITLTCTDNCMKTIYSLDGVEPQLDLTGNILNNTGSLYSTAILLDDKKTTTLKYKSMDLAGNIETVKTSQFTIDTELPSITITAPNPYYISSSGSVSSSSFSWSTTRLNLPYYIYLNSNNCNSGTLYQSGTIYTSPMSISISASNLNPGINTVLICEQNLVGNYGSSSVSIFYDNTAPSISTHWGFATYPQYTFSCSDTHSGCKNLAYTFNGSSNTVSGANSVLLQFNYEINSNILISAQDNAGNSSSISKNICVIYACISYERECYASCIGNEDYCRCRPVGCDSYFCVDSGFRECNSVNPSYNSNGNLYGQCTP